MSGGIKLDRTDVRGAIEFKDVVFRYAPKVRRGIPCLTVIIRYPTREGKLIFNKFSLSVPPGVLFLEMSHALMPGVGQSLALVGESGSGKRLAPPACVQE